MVPCPFAQRLTEQSSLGELNTRGEAEAENDPSRRPQCPFQRSVESGTEAPSRSGDQWTHARSESILCPLCHTPPVPRAGGYALALPCTHVYCGACAANGVRDCLLCGCTVTGFVQGSEHVKEDALFEDIRQTAAKYLTLNAAQLCVQLGVKRREPFLLETAIRTYARELGWSEQKEALTELQAEAVSPVASATCPSIAEGSASEDVVANNGPSMELAEDAWLTMPKLRARVLYAVACGTLAEMKLSADWSSLELATRSDTVREAYHYAKTSVDVLLGLDRLGSPFIEQALEQSLMRLEWAARVLRNLRSSTTRADKLHLSTEAA